MFEATLAPEAARSTLVEYLESWFQADRVILTGSGTQALQLGLAYADSTPPGAGRPVALPAYTCFDVATAAVGANIRVIFYDVDPISLSPDLDGIRRALQRGAGSVVASNLYGYPIDWPTIKAECESAGALLIEDAAQGVGSAWGVKRGGTFGHLTVLSFGRGKGWTGGAGGALLVRCGMPATGGQDKSGLLRPLETARPPATASLRAAVISAVQWAMGRPSLFGIPMSIPGLDLGETRFKEPSVPTSIGAFSAAAAMGHAAKAMEEVVKRQANASGWRQLLQGSLDEPTRFRFCHPLDEGTCAYLRFPVLASDRSSATGFARATKRFGVAHGYPILLPHLPTVLPLLTHGVEAVSGAKKLASSLLTLPTHSLVKKGDKQAVMSAFVGENAARSEQRLENLESRGPSRT